MAELAKLDIQIGADVKDATRGLDQLNKSLNTFDATAKKAGKSAGSGAAALFSLSQVARDLPFGFVAIQNNLPQVVDSFGALFSSSKNAGAGLKALGSALIGAGGIGLAFSAVASSATYLIQKYGSLSAGLDAVLGLTTRAEQAQRAIAVAFDESAASVQGEVLEIEQLTRVLADNNRSQEERKNAYLILKKEYPGIIQNMTLEKALTSEGTALIAERSRELIKYILLKGKEAALVKLVEEETKKQLKAQKELDDNRDKVPTSALDFFSPIAFNTVVGLGKLGVETDKAAESANYYAKALEKVRDELLTVDSFVSNLEKSTEKATKTIQKAADKTKPVEIPFVLAPKANVEGRTADQIIQDQFKVANPIDIPLTIKPDLEPALKTFEDTIFKIKTQFDILNQDLVNNLNEVLQQGIVDVFSGLGEAIGQALAGSNLGGIQKVFQAIGSTLSQLGKLAIETGVKLLLLKNALKVATANPALLIAAGVALSALGSIVKSKFASNGGITGFAQGGVVTKPTLAMIGEAGEKEAVIPLSKLGNLVGGIGGGGQLTASISGDQLIFLLNRAERGQTRKY